MRRRRYDRDWLIRFSVVFWLTLAAVIVGTVTLTILIY